VLTLAIYVILGLAVAGVLFFVSVALFGGSTTARVPEYALQPLSGAPSTDGDGLESDGRSGADGVIEPTMRTSRSDLVLVTPDAVPMELPADRPIRAEDVDRLRIPVALRGYRMAETDEAFDRLAAELRQRDEEIAQLRRSLRGEPPADQRVDLPLEQAGPADAGALDPADAAADGVPRGDEATTPPPQREAPVVLDKAGQDQPPAARDDSPASHDEPSAQDQAAAPAAPSARRVEFGEAGFESEPSWAVLPDPATDPAPGRPDPERPGRE
jgi:hypothetical protein